MTNNKQITNIRSIYGAIASRVGVSSIYVGQINTGYRKANSKKAKAVKEALEIVVAAFDTIKKAE